MIKLLVEQPLALPGSAKYDGISKQQYNEIRDYKC